MKIVFYGNMACYFGRQMKWDPLRYSPLFLDESTEDAEITLHCQNADILVSMIFDARFVSNTLQRILVPGIGVDKIDYSLVPEHVPVLTCAAHEEAIAEYILSYVIAHFRELATISANFKTHYDWQECSRLGGAPRKQLSDLTVGVIGAGGIGRKLAEVFTLLGATLRCLTRFPFESARNVSFFPRNQRDAFLNGCDVVIVACGVDEQTRDIIDEGALAVMSEESLLINVARGECVDYAALAQACRERKLGGAVIDVWPVYPTEAVRGFSPTAQDFNQIDNIIMTPHISAWTRTVVARRAEQLMRYINALSCTPCEHVMQEGQA